MPDTNIDEEVQVIHAALADLVGIMNSPQRDAGMIREAGISLDRALFPLLLTIDRKGPIGVTELADLVGRDYTTVSRQVPKLEELGLIERQASTADRRVREAVITEEGREMAGTVDATRKQVVSRMLADWNKRDLQALGKLMRRLADDVMAHPPKT